MDIIGGMRFNLPAIRDHVGITAFQKGNQYFTSGKVISCDIEDDFIYGKVKGTTWDPYEVEMFIEDGEILDSDCSCPVGFSCKHVAALALKALVKMSKNPPPAAGTIHKPTSKPQKKSEWQNVLSQLIGNKNQNRTTKTFSLQILLNFEGGRGFFMDDYLDRSVFTQLSPTLQRRLKSFKGSQERSDPVWDLVLRPRIYDDETGKYSVTHIKWNDVSYNSNIFWDGLSGHLPEKHFLYLQLLSAGVRSYYGNGWEKVENSRAEYVWKILKEHDNYSVSLLGGKKGNYPVDINETPLNINLLIEDTNGGVRLRKAIQSESKTASTAQIAYIGDPAVFAVAEEGDRYVVHPVITRLPKNSAIQKPLFIPKHEIIFFQKEYLPNLAKDLGVTSNTSAVTLPETVTPTPFLAVKHAGKGFININTGISFQKKEFLLNDIPDYIDINGKTILFNYEYIISIKEIFNKYLPEPNGSGAVLAGIPAARFIGETIPKLQEVLPNLVVQMDKDLHGFKFETQAPEVSYIVDETDESNDWFDLQVSVRIGSEDVPFHELFSALVGGQEFLLLESGTYFSLNTPQFDKLKKLITEAKSIQDKEIEGIRLTRFQAGLWEELQETGIVLKQVKRWQEAMKGLLSLKEVSVLETPKNTKAVLRPYQAEGYSWMHFLREHRLGGILADDMGLGKTIQAIAFMTKKISEIKDPFLVVAPTSVVENWDMELVKFAPKLKKNILRAGDRSKAIAGIRNSHVTVISYPLLIRDFDKFKDMPFDTVFFDEAQMVKNYQSRSYTLARKLKAHSKIALTGTPMENNLMELWAVCSLVAPGLFPAPDKFTEVYRTPIERRADGEALQRLRRRIRPFILRRAKALVAKQLPAKNEQVLRLELNDEHRYLYDKRLQYERKRVLGLLATGGLKEHRFEILRSLMKLRQMCLHPGLLEDSHAEVSATKLEILQERIEELIAEGHRILVFSQFTSFLRLVRQIFDKAGYKYLYLAGETKNRGDLIKRFNTEKEIPIFLISLKAGGFGLNLTAADYCILLDPWWNPAVEQQAIDRTHRIGQTKPVFVYKLIAKNTVEEKVLALQEKKRKLFKNVLDEGELFGSLITEEDIRSIFT